MKELEARQADDLAEFGLMEMRALRAEQERDEAYERLKPFANVAGKFLFAIAPDGIDDALTVIAYADVRPDREVRLSTADFSAARDLVLRLAAGPEKEEKE